MAPSAGMVVCQQCQAGKFANETGLQICHSCEAGSYNPMSASRPDLAEAEQSTNAVVSPTTSDFFLTRAGRGFVTPAASVPIVQLVGVGAAVSVQTYREGHESTLQVTADVAFSFFAIMITLYSFAPPSARPSALASSVSSADECRTATQVV